MTMLRFKPDDWADTLLRPLLMGDPSAGLYYEHSAPDWRFAVLALVVLVAFAAGQGRARALSHQRQVLLMLAVLFYLWTVAIGNGRYFIVGLMMVGPLLVMAWQWLPGGRGRRWGWLLGFVLIQGLTVFGSHRPGSWHEVSWTQGPALPLDDSPLRRTPAVFVTASMNGYSALVPFFHPQSRWIKMSQQMAYRPGSPEHRAMQALLTTNLPVYLLAPASQVDDQSVQQPNEAMQRMMTLLLARFPLALAHAPCEILHTGVLPVPQRPAEQPPAPKQAFWLCPLRVTQVPAAASVPADARVTQVFAQIEAYCPRFFPTGESITLRAQDYWQRFYPISDTRVYVNDTGSVSYRYYRSPSEVHIGSLDEVSAGRLTFDCSRLVGRYQPPWRQH